MFAHYNQHYQQAGGAAVSTNGMVWNGNAWVHAAAGQQHTGNTGRHSTYSTGAYGAQQQHHAAGSQQQQPQELSSLVTKYTQYYHQWTARAKEHEQHVQRLPLNSAERTQAQSHADWSKYYADQASRAAHHYHSNPHTPAPFELPPAPPEGQQQQQQQQQQQHVQQAQGQAPVAQLQHAMSTPSARKGSRWDEVPSALKNGVNISRNPESFSASSDGPPDGLKRYVHRCLERCETPEQTKAVERETERVIAKALETGTLHNKNWDIEPLIALPGMSNQKKKRGGESVSPPSSSSHQSHQSSKKQKLTSNDSYYGPSSGATSQPSATSWDSGDQGGYYGPSNGSSHTAPQTSHYQQQHQQQSKYQMGHYGPVTGDDGNQDFIAVPQFGGGGKKNGKKGSNKYVNPNSTKHSNPKNNDGFQRNSDTLAKRANRFSGPGGNADVRHATAKGIEDRYMGKGVIGGSSKQLDENDYEHMKVKGTCTRLDKQYLRLTAPPKAELVRPLHILQQHLKNLKDEWKSPNKRDYLWFCSEMKSMRQDLTVQHISNLFTVSAYQFHARIALQEGDLNEFNQAQTQLRILYKTVEDPKALEDENEFVAYLLIYFVMLSLNKKYTGGSSDLLKLMLSLTPAQRDDPAIQHALQLRAAVADMDYHKFFHRLYPQCPNLGGKLMDLMVPTVRHWALQRIVRAFRPSIPLVYVLKELGMKADSPEEIEEGRAFLVSCGCVLSGEGSASEIQAKESVVRESDLQEKRSLI